MGGGDGLLTVGLWRDEKSCATSFHYELPQLCCATKLCLFYQCHLKRGTENARFVVLSGSHHQLVDCAALVSDDPT
jgi:hypothetical protein